MVLKKLKQLRNDMLKHFIAMEEKIRGLGHERQVAYFLDIVSFDTSLRSPGFSQS